jgi:Asp-tRNA(Asn)/Glu-tRNA(Gln) amidotransferase A subunit family amidase
VGPAVTEPTTQSETRADADLVDPEPLAPTAAALASGARGPVAYATERCDRAAAVEPEIEAFVGGIDRDRAAGLAAARGRDGAAWDRPPLHGVPVGVKDIFHVEGLPTRAGSTLPPAALTGPEAPAVTALREAGAYTLGKTVTTEFAYADPGPTRNPHDPAHTPGGSSSGSAAAVAAGAVPLALGSQTVGSVIRPAAFCGVVGYKPSHGRIPTEGVVPFAPSVDHVGTFTADTAGTRLAASVLCDGWDADAADPAAVDAPVVGVPEGGYLDRASAAGREAFEAAVEALSATHELRRVELDLSGAYDHHRPLIQAEMALAHADWYADHADRYADVTADHVEAGLERPTAALVDGRRSVERTRALVAERTAAAGVDVLACPAAPGPAPAGIDDTGDSSMNLPWTHAGVPVVTLPAGLVDGLPVGVQFVGPYAGDEALLAATDGLASALPAGTVV